MTNGPRKRPAPAPAPRREISYRRRVTGAALASVGAVLVTGLIIAAAYTATANSGTTSIPWLGVLEWSVIPALLLGLAARLIIRVDHEEGPSLWVLLGGALVVVMVLMVVVVAVATQRATPGPQAAAVIRS
jgi:hypothetical protein